MSLSSPLGRLSAKSSIPGAFLALPGKEEAALATWRKYNPTWALKVWNGDEIGAVVAAHHPRPWQTLQRISNHGQKADLARYVLLTETGGIYADIDVYFVGRSLDELLQCSRSLEFVAVVENTLTGACCPVCFLPNINVYHFCIRRERDTIRRQRWRQDLEEANDRQRQRQEGQGR